MSEYIAQKRPGTNDTVHLFEDRHGPALCTNWRGEPTFNSARESFEVSVRVIRDDVYLTIDDVIVGRVCGNCRGIVCGAKHK